MYTIIALCDTITGLVTFVHSAILFSLGSTSKSTNKDIDELSDMDSDLDTSIEWLICISSVVTTITLRSSLFFNVVLVIIRTINITRPITLIRKRAVLACICIYSTILAAGALADVISYNLMQIQTGWLIRFKYFLVEYSFLTPIPNFHFLTFFFAGVYNNEVSGTVGVLVAGLLLGIPFITMPLLFLISVICSIIQVVYLLKNNAAASNNTTLREAVQRRMTVTILLLTTVCFICNLPYTCYLIFYVFNGDLGIFLYVTYFTSTLLPFINAAISPLLLILRSKALRKFIWQNAEVFKNTLITKKTQTVVTTI